MTATYDSALPAGHVRVLISDVGGDTGSNFLYQDDEIDAFLGLNAGNVWLAAAAALRAIAANEAQVSKRIQYLGLHTDGAEVARSLNSLADRYERRAKDEDENHATGFGIAVSPVDPFAARDLRGRNPGF